MSSRTARWGSAWVIGAGLVLAACGGTTRATEVRVSPSAAGLQRMTRALVVGATANLGARQSYESAMAAALQKEGVQADRSLDVVGQKLPERSELERVVNDRGYDAVVVAFFAGRRSEPRVVTTGAPFYPGYYDPWVAGYGVYTTMEDYVMVDTLVFRTGVEKKGPVFTARTETWDPKSSEEVVKGTVKASTDEMKKRGIL